MFVSVWLLLSLHFALGSLPEWRDGLAVNEVDHAAEWDPSSGASHSHLGQWPQLHETPPEATGNAQNSEMIEIRTGNPAEIKPTSPTAADSHRSPESLSGRVDSKAGSLATSPTESKRLSRSESSFKDGCPICLAEWTDGGEITNFPGCEHPFHKKCLKLWSKRDNSCPICRHVPSGQRQTTIPGNVLERWYHHVCTSNCGAIQVFVVWFTLSVVCFILVKIIDVFLLHHPF